MSTLTRPWPDARPDRPIGAPKHWPADQLCRTCHGAGEVLVRLYGASTPEDFGCCPTCHGTGVSS